MTRLYLEPEALEKLCSKFEAAYTQGGITQVEAMLPSMGEATRIKYITWKDLIEAKKLELGNTVKVEHAAEVPVAGDYTELEQSLKGFKVDG